MSWGEALPWAILSSSLVPGIAIFFVPEPNARLRSWLNLIGAVAKVLLIGVALVLVYRGGSFAWQAEILPGIDLILALDPLGLLFTSLSGGLWLVTTVFAIGYMEAHPHRSRFFGFFCLCVTATVGIAMAGNLFTLFLFYELLTLATYPLIVHDGTAEARRVGRMYLAYTLGGGALVLGGAIWLQVAAGPIAFAEPENAGVLIGAAGAPTLTVIFGLLIVGFGVKTAIVPLHGWLPAAMIAPTPVSALLHAVAVVKAGAFGIVRVVYDVYGHAAVELLGLALPLAIAASVTILYGSLRALVEDELKARLAFSTISQLSYIVLGTAIGGPVALAGGLVHLVHQGVMKITMFFCAGALHHTIGVSRVSEMAGAGRRMPWTMAAFSIAALGMIGLPPTAGFISKWYLGTGGLDVGQPWVVPLLLTSALFNAAYFLPIVHRAWFHPPPAGAEPVRCEAKASLLVPTLLTAILTLLLGLFAAVPGSAFSWASLIAAQEFRP